MLWTYDGALSLILLPICGMVVSTVCVAAVLAVGLILRVRPLGRFWSARRTRAGALAAVCLAIMCFGSNAGLTGTYTDPETGRDFSAIHPVAALLSYFTLLFILAHWPANLVRPALRDELI